MSEQTKYDPRGESVNLKRIVLYSTFALSIAVALFAIYGWVDTAVSLDHARQQQKSERESKELLRSVLVTLNRGANRAELQKVLHKNLGGEHIFKDEGDSYSVDGIVFRFDKSGALSNVEFLDQ
jgi:hypothetical protein